MQITWLTNRYFPDKGGMAVSATRIVHGLRDRGHHVQVIHLTRGQSQTAQSMQANRLDVQRVMTVDVSEPDQVEALYWCLQNSLSETLLVGFGGGQPGYLASLWARWCHTQSLVLFRGNDFEKKIHDSKQAPLTHFILNEADAIGCVSSEMCARVKTLRRRTTVFTPNSIDLSQWTLLDRDRQQADAWKSDQGLNGKPIVGMVGQLKAKKGLDIALHLFTTFGLQEQAMLLTVGDVPLAMREPLRALGDTVYRAVPFLGVDDLPGYYASMDIVFLPSYYDGMPNVLLEAMALGRIVVASKAGAMSDVVTPGETGFLFEIGDIVDAAKALRQALCLTAEQRQTITNNARNLMQERFSLTQEINVYETLLADMQT